MDDFDYSNFDHRKIRMYRTRALAAGLYARRLPHSAISETWAFLAQSWTDLADIKERSCGVPRNV